MINDKPEILNDLISNHIDLPGVLDVEWLSPLKDDCYAEYRGTRSKKGGDCAFLDILGLSLEKVPLKNFWPDLGPQWDALGKYDEEYYFIVESKAYPNEMKGSCGAEEVSRQKITRSLDCVKMYLGVQHDNDWLNNYYQYANRIAHLYYLRVLNQAPSYLVFINFINDPDEPTSLTEWNKRIPMVHKYLGLESGNNLKEYILDVFIDVNLLG